MRPAKDPTEQHYPRICTSEFCGRGGDDCNRCEHGPALADFKAWRERTGAVQLDWIWCPGFYVTPERRKEIVP